MARMEKFMDLTYCKNYELKNLVFQAKSLKKILTYFKTQIKFDKNNVTLKYYYKFYKALLKGKRHPLIKQLKIELGIDINKQNAKYFVKVLLRKKNSYALRQITEFNIWLVEKIDTPIKLITFYFTNKNVNSTKYITKINRRKVLSTIIAAESDRKVILYNINYNFITKKIFDNEIITY